MLNPLEGLDHQLHAAALVCGALAAVSFVLGLVALYRYSVRKRDGR